MLGGLLLGAAGVAVLDAGREVFRVTGWVQAHLRELVLRRGVMRELAPGVAATGDSIDEYAAEMRDAIAFHVEGLHDAGEPVPPSISRGRTVDVAA